MPRLGQAALSCLVAALLASCGGGKAPASKEAEFAVAKTYERGPVTLELKVSKNEITIADRITVLLEATADEDYEVQLPKFGDKLEQFVIVDYRRAAPVLGEGGRVTTAKSYELEPFLSGDYEIPPMTVIFWKKGAERTDANKHELKTEKLTIEVKSILPEKEAELAIKPIAGPVELPPAPRQSVLPIVAAVCAGLAVVVLMVLWVRRRRRPEALAPTIPAHELAYNRLEALLAQGLLERGEVKAFYRRLSHVLRRYIEDRFGLHAPERTTEEFLDELATSDALGGEFRPLLREFLSHCDLVKFAELRPTNDQIQKTFEAAKDFIEATKADQARVLVPTAAA